MAHEKLLHSRHVLSFIIHWLNGENTRELDKGGSHDMVKSGVPEEHMESLKVYERSVNFASPTLDICTTL